MAYIGIVENEYGALVTQHICDYCGCIFTVATGIASTANPDWSRHLQHIEDGQWDGCLAEACESYDITRDIDRVWDGVQKFVTINEA